MGICLSEEDLQCERHPFAICNGSSEPVYIVQGNDNYTVLPRDILDLSHSCNYGLVIVDEVIPLTQFKHGATPLVDGRMAYLYGDNLTIADLRRVTQQ